MTSPVTPRFSFVTCTFQSERYVRRCYASLVLQTVGDWEWVVVDDASSDRTTEVLAAIGDPRIRVVRLPKNLGRGRARQVGLEHARGRWSAIIDMDDFCLPDRLERAERALSSGYDFYCSAVVLIDDRYAINGIRPADLGGDPRKFPHATLCGATELLRRIGYTEDRRGEDLRLVLVLANNYRGFYDDHALYVYHEDAATNVKGAIWGKFCVIRVVMGLLRAGQLRRTSGVARLLVYEVSSLLLLCPLLLAPRLYRTTIGLRVRTNTLVEDLPKEHLSVIQALARQFPNRPTSS